MTTPEIKFAKKRNCGLTDGLSKSLRQLPRKSGIVFTLFFVSLLFVAPSAQAFECLVLQECRLPGKCRSVSYPFVANVHEDNETVVVKFPHKEQTYVLKKRKGERQMLTAAAGTLSEKLGVKSLTIFKGGQFTYTHHATRHRKSGFAQVLPGVNVYMGTCLEFLS